MAYNVQLNVVSTPPQERKPVEVTLYAEYQPGERFSTMKSGERHCYEVMRAMTLNVKEVPCPIRPSPGAGG